MLLVMKTHNVIGVFQSVNTKFHTGSWCDGAFLLPLKGLSWIPSTLTHDSLSLCLQHLPRTLLLVIGLMGSKIGGLKSIHQ